MSEPQNRTRQVQIRLTEDEYALLERRTPAGLLPGPYARSLLLAALTPSAAEPERPHP